MGKNVYAAPRKRPAGKWVEKTGNRLQDKEDKQQSRQERLQELASQYKKHVKKDKGNLEQC